jgi:uncharacterized coiled-coil protein SlyX
MEAGRGGTMRIMEQRLVELEEKMAFLEHDVEELDAVIRELYKKIELMGVDVQRLRRETAERYEQLERRVEGEDESPPEPPRY